MKENHQYQPSVGAPVFAAVLAALLCLIFRVCSSAHELEVSISKKAGEEDFYLEKDREYRSEKNVFEDYTEEERSSLFCEMLH